MTRGTEAWESRGGAMREDGLHGAEGYDVWKGDERADDSFFQGHADAQEMADRLNREDDGVSEETELEARFEGWWTRLSCAACGEVFEIEDDPHNGQEVECDACGAKLKVAGR